MKITVHYIILGLSMILCASCSGGWREPASVSEQLPPVFPDYVDVTVPANIAPLNFMVEDAEHIQASFSHGDASPLKVTGRDGVLSIPMDEWHGLLAEAEGGSIDVEVSVWSEASPEGVRYRPFSINVASGDIDPWIAYRLIEPGYVGWRQLGLYQRELSSFEETEIVTNRGTSTTCLNCHHFPAYSSESIMFHARGGNGGTILYHEGKLTKIDFKSIGPKKNTTYPAWHPEGRFIAFSANTTHQSFFAEGLQPIEVYDDASDLLLYDTKTGEVITDPRFMTAETLESFPSWSPDGKFLYFVAADVKLLPDDVRNVRYHLMRVPFNPETRTFGERVDTLYNAHERGGSISHPRVSADGRYVLYTWSEYGTFPVWHPEADLRMMDLQTMEDVDVSVWNDPEQPDSYHSWSSDGRWALIGSRRTDGRYTRVFIGYFDESGKAHKPFLLPQEDPRHNTWRLKSYNVPEFIDGRVELPDEVNELFVEKD